MKTSLTPERLSTAAGVLKCIAHRERLLIVQGLEAKPRTVQELVRLLKLEQAIVSKHLAILKKGGVVDCSVRGNYRDYRIKNRNVLSVLDCMRRHDG